METSAHSYMTKKTTRESQYKHTKSEEQENDQAQEVQMTAKDGQKESHQKETKENQNTDHHQKDMESKRTQKEMAEHQKEHQLQQHHQWQVRNRNDIETTE